MHVFVAGATGAMGVPLVRRLVAAGHRVTGLNIVDDEPVTWRDYLSRLAEVLGAPRPWRLPASIFRLVAPYAAMTLTSRFPTSNAKARRELGWQPTYPTYREGLATLASGAVPARR